jgi:hypothetical protein
MIELISLELQKDFPINDISDDNAATLELLLADSAMREACHSTAERTSSLYKLSHHVLRELIPTIPGMSAQDAHYFNQGVIQYEAAASLIRLDAPGQADHLDDIDTAGYVMYLLHHDDQFNYFDRAHSRLLNDQEKFSEILTSIAMRASHSDPRAVENTLFGAAVQRQIEIDAFKHNEEKFRRDAFGDTGA